MMDRINFEGGNEMKYVRFERDNSISYGSLEGNTITLIDGDLFNTFTLTDKKVALDSVRLLSPCQPTKAVCVGLNYHDHAAEMKLVLPTQPLIFLKPSSSLNHPNGAIEYPSISHNLHYEGEMAIVIGKTARKVPADKAYDYILGYTAANDVTARDVQMGDGQWTRGKSFDTFLPLGPCIVTNIDPHSINIKLYINEEVKQSSNTCQLIFKVPEIVAFVTQVMTLYPGDVILTGTPSGVGPMNLGDIVTVELEGIGKLINSVVQG